MTTFGERLRNLRNQRGLTQREFGKHFKLSESAIGMYERDQREPSLELVRRMADFFEVSIDYILGRDTYVHEGKARYSPADRWTEEERELADALIQALRSRKGKGPLGPKA
ncbi:helix-turn-helix domain-containing protein [Gorillibacterium sp. sgz5001074]|uniref:helix-turn-helix domain-containing protein n=1 Tax=Gorillibacterium sp. sgz5001074 TaxID=3446695 RepID=UPI003F67A78E